MKTQINSRSNEAFVGELVVTPKEIDALIDNAAKTLAGGLNLALHPGIEYHEVSTFLQ